MRKFFVRSIEILFVILAGVISAPTCHADPPFQRDLYNQIELVMKKCASLTPGVTRAKVLEDFLPNGGLSATFDSTFVYKTCPNIQVRIKFKPTEPGQKEVLPTDQIETVSKPFLEDASED